MTSSKASFRSADVELVHVARSTKPTSTDGKLVFLMLNDLQISMVSGRMQPEGNSAAHASYTRVRFNVCP